MVASKRSKNLLSRVNQDLLMSLSELPVTPDQLEGNVDPPDGKRDSRDRESSGDPAPQSTDLFTRNARGEEMAREANRVDNEMRRSMGEAPVEYERPPGSEQSGFMDGFYSGLSETVDSWGVGIESYNDLFNDPGQFLHMWGENEGQDTSLLDHRDVQTIDTQAMLSLIGGYGSGNVLEMRADGLNRMKQPGGKYMTLGDVGRMLYGDPNGVLSATLSGMTPQEEASIVQDYTFGAIQNTMPGPMAGLYMGLMEQASREYTSAKMQGTFSGSYLDFLQQNGYADTIYGG